MSATEIEMKEHIGPHHPSYLQFTATVQENLDRLLKSSKTIFKVATKKGELHSVFLDAFPKEERQYHNCSCCRAFMSRYGNLVRIHADGTVQSLLWDFDGVEERLDPSLVAPVKAIQKHVEKLGVRMVYVAKETGLGTEKATAGGFNHLHATLPKEIINTEWHGVGKINGANQQSYTMLSKFVNTTDQDLIDKCLTYFQNDAFLSMQAGFVANLEWLANFKRTRDGLTNRIAKDNYTWLQVGIQGFGRTRIGSTPIGTFIENVKTDGYDVAKEKFKAMTHGLVYKRAQSAPKAGTINNAEKIFAQMELAPSLRRRFLTHPEVKGEIWVPKAPKVEEQEAGSVFGHLKAKDGKTANDSKAPELPLMKGGVLTLKRFLEEIMPSAEAISFVFQRMPYPIAGFDTAVLPEAKPLLKWDEEDARNPVGGYHYHGGSAATDWGLPFGQPIKVLKIVRDYTHWAVATPFNFEQEDVVFIFEGGKDNNLRQIPIGFSACRDDLHEVRSVLENFFKTGKLEPLPEGEQQVVGVFAPHQGQMRLDLIVEKEGAKIAYVIDRAF